MDVFSTLSARAKMTIMFSTSSILIVALALLLFGGNTLGHENELIHKAAEATRADMLYIHPDSH